MSVEAIQVRLDEHGRRLTDLERTQPAVLAAELRELRADLAEVREEQRATKRALYTVALSVTAAAVTFAFTVFQIWGTGP